MSNLREIAERAKLSHGLESSAVVVDEANHTKEVETVVSYAESNAGVVSADYVDDDDEPVVFTGESSETLESDIVESLTEEDLAVNAQFGLSDEEFREIMKDMDEDTFMKSIGNIRMNVDAYRKELIISQGFTVEEAAKAAIQRMKKLGEEENNSYLEENPTLAIVKVDKTNVDNLDFTPKEREKLSKVRAIKLEVVEDATLKTIEIERIDKNLKVGVIQSIDTGLSQYSIPLPLMSDYCRFKGSQIIQLIQAVKYDDATLDEIISKKAALIYSQLSNCANLRKYDYNGKTIMTYK